MIPIQMQLSEKRKTFSYFFAIGNLTIPIQMQLLQKQKAFFQFSTAFSKSRLNFQHFETKDNPNRFFISGIMESENPVK